jgi:DNA primase
MHQAGVENVVASSGTSLTSGQIRMIHRFTNNITVLYDGDMAGIKASIRGIDMLLEEGMNIKVMLLPDGDDPDSFARKHNATEFQEYIAAHEVDFIRFKTNLLMSDAANDPYKRASLITDIVKSISVIPEAIVRSEYIKECSQMLHVEEKLLVNEVAKMKRAEEEKKTKSSTSSSQEEKSRSDAPQASPTSQATNQPIEYTDIPPISVQDLPPMGVDDVTEQGWSTHDAATPANTPLIDFNSVSPLYSQERLIIQQLIRYGERTIYKDDESGRDVSVIEYLNADLANDGITLTTPLFDQLLKESLQHVYDEGFTAERYFIAHADAQISRLAADLVEEKYQLSKYHSNVVDDVDRLNDIIPHLLNDYKMSIIEQNLKEILNDLRQPSTMNDPVKCQETMLRYKQLMELKQRMAKILGDRVIGM